MSRGPRAGAESELPNELNYKYLASSAKKLAAGIFERLHTWTNKVE